MCLFNNLGIIVVIVELYVPSYFVISQCSTELQTGGKFYRGMGENISNSVTMTQASPIKEEGIMVTW